MRKAELLMGITMLISHFPFARQTGITGKITDSKDGAPIANATVKIKGGGATVTDAEGIFTLLNSAAGATLEISSVGYLTKSVKIVSGKYISIQLNYDPKSLSEVVVTGVGVATSKKKLANNFSQVTAYLNQKGGFTFSTRYRLLDGGNALSGVQIVSSRTVGAYELYLAAKQYRGCEH